MEYARCVLHPPLSVKGAFYQTDTLKGKLRASKVWHMQTHDGCDFTAPATWILHSSPASYSIAIGYLANAYLAGGVGSGCRRCCLRGVLFLRFEDVIPRKLCIRSSSRRFLRKLARLARNPSVAPSGAWSIESPCRGGDCCDKTAHQQNKHVVIQTPTRRLHARCFGRWKRVVYLRPSPEKGRLVVTGGSRTTRWQYRHPQ